MEIKQHKNKRPGPTQLADPLATTCGPRLSHTTLQSIGDFQKSAHLLFRTIIKLSLPVCQTVQIIQIVVKLLLEAVL